MREINTKRQGEGYNLIQKFKLILPFFVFGFTTTGLMDTHLIPFAQHCGFTVTTPSADVSILAVFNTAGTIAAGILLIAGTIAGCWA
ncbi:hypothetical protein CVD28_18640 [Bacillus sp. M6-12]|uniref:hypothetical protein n=1 Tax=Bacillus sp. M6-12 TaxID=2054166 RepID=UPI000C769E28|nr:hypothetical protein [Bacillus sp. M6-12]PLS16065.1 hypothetical protein CVD28_18640 [Bacillus sp. M6-12]